MGKIKKTAVFILTCIFWIAVAITMFGGLINTFVKSSDDPQDDYEEYIQSIIP